MKEMQLRTTSSLRALLNTEPLLPIMDTEIQQRDAESLQGKTTAAANIRAFSHDKTYFIDLSHYVKSVTVENTEHERTPAGM